MCVDLDRRAVGVSAGRPHWNMAQQSQTVASAPSSLMQPGTGCVLETNNASKKLQRFQCSFK